MEDVEDAAVERANPADTCDRCGKKLLNPRPKTALLSGLEDGVHLGMKMAATGATEEQVRELVRETFAGVRELAAEKNQAQKTMSYFPRVPLTECEVILDERECAQLLGLAFESLQELRRRGEAPPYARIGKGKIVYLKTRVIEWLDENLVRGKEPKSQ